MTPTLTAVDNSNDPVTPTSMIVNDTKTSKHTVKNIHMYNYR